MPENKSPLGIVVNGAILQVKDPSLSAGLFSEYRRVPGLGSFTLPAETGSVNETTLMDGTVSAAQFKGVGTITGTVGALGAHPTHLFLDEKSLDGENVQVNIVRLAVPVNDIVVSGVSNVIVIGTDVMTVNVTNTENQDAVKSSIRAGSLVAVSALASPTSDPKIPGAKQASNVVVDYKAAVSAANNVLWQPVWEVETDGSSFKVAPGFQADKSTSGTMSLLIQVRNPGRTYKDVLCTVSQWDAGDFQNGQNVSGNITLTPSVALPRVQVEARVSL